MANNPTLYDNFERVKQWTTYTFVDKTTLAATLSDVAFTGDYNDLINTPDLSAYVTNDALSGMSYATQSYVSDAIAAIPQVDLSSYATITYVNDKIAALIDGAPAALDTLNELAAAINDDANFASTVTTALGNKANADDVYTKVEIQNMGYATEAYVTNAIADIPAPDLSAYVTKVELSGMSYITMGDVSACGYTTPLTQAQMDTLFPVSNS